MMHQVSSSSSDYCLGGLAEDCHPATHFDLCSTQTTNNNKLFYHNPTHPGLQLSLAAGLAPLPQGMHKTMATSCQQQQEAPGDFQVPQGVRLRPGENLLGPDGGKKKKGAGKSGRRGRPSGTTKSAGYRTSTGRPLGTTRAAGFKTSPGRPLGTTKAAGYKVSPGRPPGSIKSLARLKKLEFNCDNNSSNNNNNKKLDFNSVPKKLDFTNCDVPPAFPYTIMEKRDVMCEPSGKMNETSE